MCSVSRALIVAVVALASAMAWADPPDLWVCADGNNLPYSNNREEGFENKMAEMVARDLGRTLRYVWWPASPILSHRIFRNGACDVIMGIPSKDYDLAEPTQPYYSSSYVFVSRRDRRLGIRSFDDPALQSAKIGVHVIDDGFTPAAQELATRGLVKNVVGYSIFGNLATENPAADLIRAVADGKVDVAVAWGPLAGYFAQHSAIPLQLTPICAASVRTSLPVQFAISMGVRRNEPALLQELNQELTRRRNEIRELLLSYGVPLPENSNSISGACE